MEKMIKLIWDFHGPDSSKIAEHHEIHLKEFIEREKLPLNVTGVKKVSDLHSTAFLVVYENDMLPVRDALKPHRGEWYEAG